MASEDSSQHESGMRKMQFRGVWCRLLHAADSNVGCVNEVATRVGICPQLFHSWYLAARVCSSMPGSSCFWHTLVSKAGTDPGVLGSVSTVEADDPLALEEKQQKRIRKYQTGMKAPTLRKEMVGLYGYEVLKTAKGFRIFAQDAIEKSEDLIRSIQEMPPSMKVIYLMDDISDTVSTVVDAAELCRNTHPDKEFVEEANHASMKVYEYLQYLNSHAGLYKAVVDLEQSPNILTTDEARRAAKTLRMDFERGGIHLPIEKLKRGNDLNLEITRLGREFGEHMMRDQGQLDIFPASVFPKNIQHMMKPIWVQKDGRVGWSSKPNSMSTQDDKMGMRVVTEPAVLSSVLKYVTDAEVRKRVYMVGHSVPKANLRVLDHLIAARHELAQLLGFNTYAEFAIAPNMAQSPEAVVSFLEELSMKIRGRADEELRILAEFQKQVDTGRSDDVVNPWDESYYAGLLKSRTHDLNAAVVASYFPVEQCLEALRIMSGSLFGATFEQVPVSPGEAWHSDVQKLTLLHADEGELGHMYLDLYGRPGKFPGCAHFTLKGCRQISPSNYQLPVVALVCNFVNPNGKSPPILNHWEVETLFHEFGHALHSLLSRTDYQHFSGTRTVLDFSETPSQLFEYYAWDYRVLSKFGRHYLTGETIPEKLVASMNQAKRMFSATEIQRQVLYALIDQTLFGKQPLPAKDTTAVIAELKQRHTGVKHVNGTHWHTRFNHLVSYGAGYYSYLYARCFAASIWHSHCLNDPLSTTTGDKLRRGFLMHGGAKDPSIMMQEFLGQESVVCSSSGVRPCTDQLLADLGLP